MQPASIPTRQRQAAIATLLLLSPIIVEVLFGATHLTTIFLLIPQICIYGSAALIIRALARRHRRGWASILLLGLAFAVAEECIILQTSVSPVFFGGQPSHIYSWAFGVNWIYLLWAVVYETVWAILLPIQLSELIYPALRNDPWIGRRGMIISAALFLIASAAIWFRFTKVGITPGNAYQAPLLVVLVAFITILVLAATAFSQQVQNFTARKANKRAPRPWLVGLAAFGLSLPWFILPVLVYTHPASLPAILLFSAGMGWAGSTLFLFHRWTASPAWQDTHRLAAISGALAASMLAGYLVSGISLPLDLLGKLLFNAIAVLLLIFMALKIRRRNSNDIA